MEKMYLLNQWHLFSIDKNYFVYVSKNLRLYKVDKGIFCKLQLMQEQYGYDKEFQYKKSRFIDELIDEQLVEESKENNTKVDFLNNNLVSSQKNNGNINSKMVNVTLQIANDCNLNCIYCYGQGGSYGRNRELMPYITAKKAVDLLVNESGDAKELLIVFFGGEPLLNFSVIKQVVQYCDDLREKINKSFSFSITTNGTIMDDEIYSFIKNNKISVMLSMDGGKELQDYYRCYENGKGSFEQVSKNIEKFKSARNGQLSVRATVCKPNLNFLKINTDLHRLGFTNVNMSIVDIDSESPLFVGEKEKNVLIKNLIDLSNYHIKEIKSGKEQSIRQFDDILRNLYHKKIKIRSCNAGNNGFAVASNGGIYPCHRFMGMEDYLVGNIDQGIDQSITRSFEYANVLYKEDCINCWARFLCGGGCIHTCVSQENNIMKAPKCYCDIYRSQFEVILYLYSKLKEWDEDFFRKIFEGKEDLKVVYK